MTNSSDGPWLGRGDAPVDRATWCWVPAGQSLLTRRATACDGRDLLLTDGRGKRAMTRRLGRYVRHGQYAAALCTGQYGEITHIAAALDAVGIASHDLTALALTAPAPLGAALAARLPRSAPSEWQKGADRAVATGSDPAAVDGRRALLTALADTGPHTAATYERWLALPVDRAPVYAAAGLTWQESAGWERDRRWQHDLAALETLAALRGVAA